MNNKLLSFLFFLCLPVMSMAQQTDSLRGKFRLTIQPLQVLLLDFPVNAEFIFRKNTLGVTAGYRIAAGRDFSLGWGSGDSEFRPDFFEGKFQAMTFGINSKNYFRKKQIWYYETQLFFRRWWHRDNYGKGDTNIVYARYLEERFNIGGKFLIGFTQLLSKEGNVRPVLNVYAGIGVRGNLNQRHETFKRVGQNEVNAVRESSGVFPSIHLGLSLGAQFFKKVKIK